MLWQKLLSEPFSFAFSNTTLNKTISTQTLFSIHFPRIRILGLKFTQLLKNVQSSEEKSEINPVTFHETTQNYKRLN